MTTSPQPPHEPHPNPDRGLEFDLSTLMSRRSLGMFFGAGGAAVAELSSGGVGPIRCSRQPDRSLTKDIYT